MNSYKNVQHPIDSFGILKVSMSGIRVEKIRDRINPAVPFPHKHDFYQIMLITKGTGVHQIDFNKYKVSPSQIFFMKPGQVHSWVLSKGVEGYIIEFGRKSLSLDPGQGLGILNRVQLLPDVVLPRKKFPGLLKLTEVMFLEFQNKDSFQDLCLRNFLSAFLLQLLRESSETLVEFKNDSTLEKFHQLVEGHFRTQHRVEFYARELNVTPKALTMQITRAFGKSPRFLIQERFMLEAKRYLAFSSMSIAQIGYELGFQDSNYFSRFFKTHERMTPGEFRKKF